ncbi:MAG TPA: cupin domain-containing protein [Candidatus Nanoarchaeia archaeon]|nr:cupin domain-containing protein [Candidatus Nanoarchaeia archaeon]
MKKKTMQAWFMLLLILGIVIGYSLPGDWRTASLKPLKAGVYDVSKKMGQLDNDLGDFKYTTLVEVNDASVELFKVDNGIPVNSNAKENYFAYVIKGKVKATIGDSAYDAGAGSLIVVPAGTLHSMQRVGDSPVEMIVFSSPPHIAKETATA